MAERKPQSGVYVRLGPYMCAAAMTLDPIVIRETRPLLAVVLEAVKSRRLTCLPSRRRRAA